MCPKCAGAPTPVARPLFSNETISSPVTGWLLAIGPDPWQRVLKLANGKNYIFERDIAPAAGRDLARANAVIIFDDEANQFWLLNGLGQGVVRINGSLLINPILLRAGDMLTIGSRVMRFKPLCCELFPWAHYSKGGD
jgi:hypothetical protein